MEERLWKGGLWKGGLWKRGQWKGECEAVEGTRLSTGGEGLAACHRLTDPIGAINATNAISAINAINATVSPIQSAQSRTRAGPPLARARSRRARTA